MEKNSQISSESFCDVSSNLLFKGKSSSFRGVFKCGKKWKVKIINNDNKLT